MPEKPLTNQEVFDQSCTHLRKQGKRSMAMLNGALTCAYRGHQLDDGTLAMCAVGCLIRDEEYQPWMEGLRIGKIFSSSDTPASLIERLSGTFALLEFLQEVHDSGAPEHWEGALERVALNFGLVYTPKT